MNKNTKISNNIKGFLYIFPALSIIVIFNIYPILKSFDMSFYTHYNYYKDIVYHRGIGNFIYIFKDRDFLLSLKNTVFYVAGVVPISMVLSFGIALLLNTKIKFAGVFRTIYFIPFVTSVVAISMSWRWIYNQDHGVLNYILESIGMQPIKWLTDPRWAMTSLIVLSIWKGLGYNIIIFLAGLQNIDKQYEVAARMDGASRWKSIWHVTIPLLSPTIFFVSITSMIHCFKAFDEVFALFDRQPGPLGSCLTTVYYIYDKFYNKYQYGVASAAVLILFFIILVFNLIQLYIAKKKVHYS